MNASVIAHELGHVALGHPAADDDFPGQNALRAALECSASLLSFRSGHIAKWLMVTLLAAWLSRGDELRSG
ncbi:MAG: hypothetical protein R3D81_09675 [Thalassovita sp.]